jgi:hypothetical protein
MAYSANESTSFRGGAAVAFAADAAFAAGAVFAAFVWCFFLGGFWKVAAVALAALAMLAVDATELIEVVSDSVESLRCCRGRCRFLCAVNMMCTLKKGCFVDTRMKKKRIKL